MLNVFLLRYSKPVYVNKDFLVSLLIPSQETLYAKALIEKLYGQEFNLSYSAEEIEF